MLKSIRSRVSGRFMASAAAVVLGVWALAPLEGCETRVISAKGIGAAGSHPQTYEPSPSDKLSEKIWGENRRDK